MAPPFNNSANRPKPPFNSQNRGPRKPQIEEPYRINGRITATQIRVVSDDMEPKVMSVAQGIEMAEKLGLDLVEIAPNAEPPVCRIVDYSKFKYEQKRKQKEIKAKAQKAVLKEIRFGPNTDDHDFDFKLKHAQNFLKEGSKVKAYVQFQGRSIVYKERGEILLLKFAQSLEEYCKVEQLPLLEGKRMMIMLVPKPNSKK
ncbi:MAG: translation initiation factor IF-3 [Cytophagales bacterium]|nr:MAG: translation initiation factor IF-3 [Cytophagales bacterium]